MKENRFLGKFAEEFSHLCDVSPSLACAAIYGSWPNHRPDFKPNQGIFQAKNYLRYSEAARKEVITALVNSNEKQTFDDIIIGLIETDGFLKELDLWIKWGVNRDFIMTELNDYITVKVFQCLWLNAELFAQILDYTDMELSKQKAFNWMCGIKHKCNISAKAKQVFTDSIQKHTI